MAGSTRRASLIVLALLAAIGALCLAVNFDQPLVRNGIVYARVAEHVIEHGYDPLAVVADSRLSYDKPVGFAWLASPLVAVLGTHRGLMLASFIGTLAYLLATWAFASAFELRDRERALLLLFAGLCPIVAYQFWSAHPDGLFAALYLLAFVLAQRIVERPSIGKVALLFAAVFLALVLKNYSLILVPSCALFFLWHRRRILGAEDGRSTSIGVAIALAALSTLGILGLTGHNPLMRIEGEGGGAGQYGAGSWTRSSLGTWLQVGLTLLLNLHVALLLLARGSRARPRGSAGGARLIPALVCFPLSYVAGLMLFPTTFYNMRYFVPLLPFAALIAVLGWRASGTHARRAIPVAFAFVATFLVALFDVAPVHAAFEARIPRLAVDWLGPPLSFLDNLRMPLHRKQAELLEHLNREVEPGGVLYLLDVLYYGDAQHGVYERAGRIRPDIRTRYVRSREFAPQEPRCWVQLSFHDPALLARFGTATDLGRGLHRLDAAAPAPER